MKIVSLDQVEKKEAVMPGASGAWKQVPISSKDGAPNFSFRVFTMDPGGHTPFHEHAFEHVNYVIAGKGMLVNAAGEEQALVAGDFALVHPNEKHQYRNASASEPFVMICAVPLEYE